MNTIVLFRGLRRLRSGMRRYSVGIVTTCGVAAASAQPASFFGLDPTGMFPNGSQATAVSSDGRFVVGTLQNSAPGIVVEPFRWSAVTGTQNLGLLSANATQFYETTSPTAVSDDGGVIVGFARSTFGFPPRAFRWTPETNFDRLTPCAAAPSPTATAITPDGLRILGASDPGAALWTWSNGAALTCQNFTFPIYANTGAVVHTDISADGQVSVGYVFTTVPQRFFAVRWFADGTFEEIDQDRRPTAVNRDGTVVVEARERWTAATGWVIIPPFLVGSFGGREMLDIDGDGDRVVGFDAPFIGGPRQALIWESGVGSRRLQDVLANDYGLNLTGWTLQAATAISDDGKTIVGYGLNPQGRVEAWRAVLGFPPALLGDVNCDGVVSVGDISAFVLALTDPAGYAIQFPGCDPLRADINLDGFITVGDISGFVALLVG